VSTRKPDQKVKITKTVVDKLVPPARGQAFVRDQELRGFAVRITAGGVVSFIVEKRINGRVRRMTLGRYGELTCEQARKRAQQILGQVAMGVDPVAEQRRARNEAITLEQAFSDFLSARKDLKPRTRYDYERLLAVAFSDWRSRRLGEITRPLVATRHRQLGETRGEAYANLAMRFLRSLFNFALATYDDGAGRPILAENPVAVLTQTRAWYRNERRQTVIKAHQLPAWMQAVQALRAESLAQSEAPPDLPLSPAETARTVGDYLLLLLFTGLRRQEAARLRWEDVDLSQRTLLIPDPKNRRPHMLPLSDFVYELLAARQTRAVNEYVFPDRSGRKHLIEPKRQVQRVIAASGVDFTLHDLRRTFITVADSLDIPHYAIKRLANHTMQGDVTAGYIVADVERLREPMQKITDFLCNAARNGPPRVVISMRGTASHER